MGRASKIVALAVLVTFAGCTEDEPALRVWAAASLVDSVPELSESFADANPGEILHSFDATNRLARQIEEGAPADVFLSADLAWVEYLEERGLLIARKNEVIGENQLVVVVPRTSAMRYQVDEAQTPQLFEDVLMRADRLGLAGEGVPAGRYADAAIEAAGLTEAVAPRIVRGGSVRNVLSWVAAGEVDAAIVYETDAGSDPRHIAPVHTAVPGPTPVYVGAIPRRSAHPERAAAYLERASRVLPRLLHGLPIEGP